MVPVPLWICEHTFQWSLEESRAHTRMERVASVLRTRELNFLCLQDQQSMQNYLEGFCASTCAAHYSSVIRDSNSANLLAEQQRCIFWIVHHMVCLCNNYSSTVSSKAGDTFTPRSATTLNELPQEYAVCNWHPKVIILKAKQHTSSLTSPFLLQSCLHPFFSTNTQRHGHFLLITAGSWQPNNHSCLWEFPQIDLLHLLTVNNISATKWCPLCNLYLFLKDDAWHMFQ